MEKLIGFLPGFASNEMMSMATFGLTAEPLPSAQHSVGILAGAVSFLLGLFAA
jgi:hypothetical protein